MRRVTQDCRMLVHKWLRVRRGAVRGLLEVAAGQQRGLRWAGVVLGGWPLSGGPRPRESHSMLAASEAALCERPKIKIHPSRNSRKQQKSFLPRFARPENKEVIIILIIQKIINGFK